MCLNITNAEKAYIRELAKKQLDYSRLPVMAQRRRQWLDLNTGKPADPPVVVETWTFDRDMMPESVFRCQSPAARGIEAVLLRNIREHELINDDKVMPDFFPVAPAVSINEFGFDIGTRHAADGRGLSVGYQFEHPIVDLEKDFDKLKPAAIGVDREATRRRMEFAHDVLGGILPVVSDGTPPYIGLTEKVIKLMGMESFYMAMMDQPDAVHRLMRYLTDNQIRMMRFYEQEGLLTLNNGNHQTGMSSYGFTDELPAAGYDGRKARLKDIWLWVESEEMAGASPGVFREFVLPYVAEAASLLGLVYYGCCEPLHPVWEDVRAAIRNVRKASVSPWCDQRRMGEYLQGTGIVFSRKPLANYLGVDADLDEAAWACHIRETAEAARGCQLEIIMRDVYRIKDYASVRRAVEIARAESRL